MSYTLFKAVNFGSNYSGLTTVGYKVLDSSNTVVTARTTGSIINMGNGCYGAVITFPDGFVGSVYWDTAAGATVSAVDDINPQTAEYLDVKVSTRSVTGTAVEVSSINQSAVDSIWNRVQSATTRPAGSFGRYLDTTISSRTSGDTFNINLEQELDSSQVAGTVGRALQIARSQGRGNWVIDPNANTLVLYDTDGSTVVATFDLTPSGGPYTARTTTDE